MLRACGHGCQANAAVLSQLQTHHLVILELAQEAIIELSITRLWRFCKLLIFNLRVKKKALCCRLFSSAGVVHGLKLVLGTLGFLRGGRITGGHGAVELVQLMDSQLVLRLGVPLDCLHLLPDSIQSARGGQVHRGAFQVQPAADRLQWHVERAAKIM